MTNKQSGFCLASGFVALLLSGCANPLVFSTHTSLGLDVSGTAQYPNRISFSYDREEIALVPRQTNGAAHSVFGGLDADINFWDGSVIKQTFATGEAAKLATGSADGAPSAPSTGKTATDSLVFLTGTTFGLHLAAGESKMPPNLLLGYRRVEAAYIPVLDPGREVSSVYADVLINTKSAADLPSGAPAFSITTNFPTISGVRIKQSFATGKAAENLARGPAVRAKLNNAAGLSLDVLQKGAMLEGEIVQRLKALSETKRMAFYTWADNTFEKESGGKLAQTNNLSFFENGFLPKLESDGRTAVLEKITQLEK